jgi:hypothetical protein
MSTKAKRSMSSWRNRIVLNHAPTNPTAETTYWPRELFMQFIVGMNLEVGIARVINL